MTQPISSAAPYQSPTLAQQEGSPAMDYNDNRSQFRPWESNDGFSFWDLVDVINPLQHIPIVSTIYRALTGDEIGIAPRLAGGFLYSGPIGLVFAGGSAIFEDVTGGDMAENVATLVKEFEEGAPPPTQMVTAADIEGMGYVDSETTPENVALATVEPAAGAGTTPSATAAPVASDRGLSGPVTAQLAAAQLAATESPAAEISSSTDRDNADARIRQRIAAAQRAQAGLLLASLKAGETRFSARATKSQGQDPAVDAQAAASAGAAQPHPNLPPKGVNPDWFAAAMERALSKYRNSESLTPARAGR